MLSLMETNFGVIVLIKGSYKSIEFKGKWKLITFSDNTMNLIEQFLNRGLGLKKSLYRFARLPLFIAAVTVEKSYGRYFPVGYSPE